MMMNIEQEKNNSQVAALRVKKTILIVDRERSKKLMRSEQASKRLIQSDFWTSFFVCLDYLKYCVVSVFIAVQFSSAQHKSSQKINIYDKQYNNDVLISI